MKQFKLAFLLTVLMSMVGVNTFAHSIEVTNADGVTIYYDYNYNGPRELEVTYCYIDNSYYDDSGNWVEDYEQRPYSGNVAIPSTVTYYGTTYTVTSIGSSAFSNCWDLTSVTIPNSVTRIGDYAFFDCSGLTSVNIPSGVTYIGYDAFGYIGSSSLALVTVKMETPAEIDSSTFPNRTSETLWVPKGCKAAYETADYWKEFKEIIEISNIDFADANVKAICVSMWDDNGDGELSDVEAARVYSIESGLFSNNKNITSFDELQYFTGLHSIGYSAFSGCSSLTSVTIPSGVTSIGSYAFYNCSGLTSVNIGSSVTSIGSSAFKDCKRLKEVNYDATNCTEMGSQYSYVFEGCSSFATLWIGENVQTIPSYAFYNCSGLTSVNIGSSVTSIGSSAFYNCTGLTLVNISDLAGWCKINFANASDNPLYYTHHLFLNGEEITDLVIPSNVEYIKNYVFYGCTGLTSLSIPSSVISIGFEAFYGCSNLGIITVDENNSIYDSRDDCNAIIEKESNKLIYGCKNTVIPSSVTSIDRNAFKGCSALSSIYIPGSLKHISSLDFEGCTSLTSITVGEGAEKITASGLNGLENVTIALPNSLTEIGSQAFRNCQNCTVIIGTGIKDISDAFYNSYNMTIYCYAFNRPQTSYHCFYWATNCKSYVPFGRGEAYSSGSSLEGGYYWCSSVSEMPYPALTIGSSGYATYCSNKALDFSEDEDVKAYVATDYIASSNTLILTRVMKTSAGEGIIVVGKPGIYDIPGCTTDITYTNLLNGMILPSYIEPIVENYKNLLLSDSNSEISFQHITESTPCFAGTAYLHLPSYCLPADAQIVNVRFQETECTGDLNGDGIINGIDLVAQTNLIMTGQYDAAADLNNDGFVNGLDYVIMVNMILSETSAPAMQAAGSNRVAATSSLSIEDFDIKAGETKELFINLSNPNTDLTLLQFDMRLPEGLSIATEDGDYAIDIAGRTTWKKHSLMAKATNGITRFLLASNTNALIDGDNGNVISIKLTASDDFKGGDIWLENQLLVTPDAEDVMPADFIYSVGGTTSIDAMGSKVMQLEGVYDLQGRRVKAEANSSLFTLHSSLKKGMYIVNGKKIIVK